MARLNKWERQHLKDLSALDKRIEQIYEAAVKEAARIGATISDWLELALTSSTCFDSHAVRAKSAIEMMIIFFMFIKLFLYKKLLL